MTSLSQHSNRVQFWGWALYIATIAIATIMFFWTIFGPAPAHFSDTSILTPKVIAHRTTIYQLEGEGIVQMRTKMHVKRGLGGQGIECLAATQYFIDLPNGQTWKLPGARQNPAANSDVVIYETVVPWTTTMGQGDFYVVETYGCGIRNTRINSPKVQFEVVKG